MFKCNSWPQAENSYLEVSIPLNFNTFDIGYPNERWLNKGDPDRGVGFVHALVMDPSVHQLRSGSNWKRSVVGDASTSQLDSPDPPTAMG